MNMKKQPEDEKNSHQSRRKFLRLLGETGIVLVAGVAASGQNQKDPCPISSAILSTGEALIPDRLSGGFIQPYLSMIEGPQKLSSAQWKNVLQAMLDIKMDTVIIQFLQNADKNSVANFIPENSRTPDIAEEIFAFAEKNKMSVFVGLKYYLYWGPNDSMVNDPAWRKKESAANVDLVNNVYNRYVKKYPETFGGWYIPQELGNEPEWYSKISELTGFFKPIVDECRKKTPKKPVAASPYFNPSGFLTPEKFAAGYKSFLKAVKLDIIMLQDSVGERSIWEVNFESDLKPYYEAMAKMCREEKVRFWGDIESFTVPSKDVRVPADAERVSAQVHVAAQYVEKQVTFDFFHYMNPYGYLYEEQPSRKAAASDLYKKYKEEFVDPDKNKQKVKQN
jgi:hypothetical protein